MLFSAKAVWIELELDHCQSASQSVKTAIVDVELNAVFALRCRCWQLTGAVDSHECVLCVCDLTDVQVNFPATGSGSFCQVDDRHGCSREQNLVCLLDTLLLLLSCDLLLLFYFCTTKQYLHSCVVIVIFC